MIDLEVTLRPDERLVDQFSISQRLFWILIGAGVFLAIFIPVFGSTLLPFMDFDLNGIGVIGLIGVGLIAGALMVGYAFYFRASRHYVLTNQRFIETMGVVSKRTISADWEQITDIRVTQDAFERLVLGAGMIALNTAGGDLEEVRLERVPAPYHLSNRIRQLVEARMHEIGRPEAPGPVPVRTGPATASRPVTDLPPVELPQ